MAEEKKSITMIEKKLLNPVELVDQLSGLTNEQKGNTPRPQKSEILFVAGMKLVQQQKFDEAFKKLMEAVREAEKELQVKEGDEKKKKEGLAVALCGLGFLCALKNELIKAEVCYVRALGYWEALLGKTNPKLVRILTDIGAIFEEESKFDKAHQYYERALQLLVKAKQSAGVSKAEEDPDVLALSCTLALMKAYQKCYDEAEKIFTASIAILEKQQHPFELGARQLYLKMLQLQNRDEIRQSNERKIKELEKKLQDMQFKDKK
jgi:tetratricopeptide (TPR) repeat protein